MAKILCIDFDGVLHSYSSGWQGADVVADEPVENAIPWLIGMAIHPDFEVCIYSSRSQQDGGIEAMKRWLVLHMVDYPESLRDKALQGISFPTQKPPAYLTIDDRAICFRGTFPSILEMDSFKPWNK